MNAQEVMALLYMEKRLFPREKGLAVPPEELTAIAEAQAEMLKDIPFELGKAAVAAHAAGSPYAPAISEIRAYARKMTEPPELSADEAWEKADRAIRRFGSQPYKVYPEGRYPRELARESLPEEVWRVMDMLGYTYMCRSEKPETVRNQFIEAWLRQQKRKEEQANMAPFLPPALKEKVKPSPRARACRVQKSEAIRPRPGATPP